MQGIAKPISVYAAALGSKWLEVEVVDCDGGNDGDSHVMIPAMLT